MQSKVQNVTDYLQETPVERQPALSRLRQLCLETLEGYEEGMDYGMPGYKRDGVVEVGFASQKNYISLYILTQPVLDAHRGLLNGAKCGKGCIRYSKPAKIDFDVVEQMLVSTRESLDPVC